MPHSLTHPERLTITGPQGETYQGGDQEWYRDLWQRRAGCGPTTAAALLSYLSQVITFYPGDIIMTGTPYNVQPMKDGDVVLEVNGQKIDDSSALLRAIATEAPGSKVNMVVWRDGERKNITVQLGERNLKASSGKSGSAVEQDAPSIGLSVRPLTKEEARTANVKPGTGLLIVGVEPGKLAAEAELREGDIILSANLKPIKSVEEFSKIIREDAKKRGVVMLQLQRQGQTFFRSLALSDTPDGAKK